jgi:hypothetical protein
VRRGASGIWKAIALIRSAESVADAEYERGLDDVCYSFTGALLYARWVKSV